MSRSLFPSILVSAAFIGSAVGAIVPTQAAQEASPAAECPTTTEEENKALVTQFYEIFAGGEGDLGLLLAEEHVYHDPSDDDNPVSGAADWAEQRLETFPDVTVSIDHLLAEDDMVAAYLTWTGTHLSEDVEVGAPATSRSADWIGTAFFRIECGKIVETWSVSDELGRLIELGVITEEEIRSAEAAATPAA